MTIVYISKLGYEGSMNQEDVSSSAEDFNTEVALKGKYCK